MHFYRKHVFISDTSRPSTSGMLGTWVERQSRRRVTCLIQMLFFGLSYEKDINKTMLNYLRT